MRDGILLPIAISALVSQACIKGHAKLRRMGADDEKKVIDEALKLSPAARAALAGYLLESLDPQIDEDAEAAWDAEIAVRVRELDDGAVKPIPWSEARRIIAG